jgi:hypothetical protein
MLPFEFYSTTPDPQHKDILNFLPEASYVVQAGLQGSVELY